MRAKKSLGQNFLVDEGVAGRIVGALGPRADETVVEIGVGDRERARAADGRLGFAAADDDGRDEEADLINEAGVEEEAGDVGAAFDQQAVERAAVQLGEQRERVAAGRATHDFDAACFESFDLLGARARGGEDDDGCFLGRQRELRVGRELQPVVEHDADERASSG